jgi:hypothetical protein
MSSGRVDETGTDEPSDSEATSDASAAFQQLSDERRLAILDLLSTDGPASFSTLFEYSDSDSSAGFAYHLRQLADEFVRQREDDTWELTAPGREATQNAQSGAFTTSIEYEQRALDEHCPLCHDQRVTLSVHDSIASVSCESCGGSILRVPVPPSWEYHAEADLPSALDRYYRNRIRLFSEDVCPDCGGPSETTVTPIDPEETELSSTETESKPDSSKSHSDNDTKRPPLAQFSFACQACGSTLECPVTLAVLDDTAVTTFYDDHDVDISDRPVWNVGSEWRERVLSTDPWCLLVSSRQDDELLELYVGGDGAVHESRRRAVDEEARAGSETERREDAAA